MTTATVLVAEDFEIFRRFVVSALHNRPDLQVVSEVSDGLEAVEKTRELQPDLVVIDIGLPGMNGIEAARLIREVSPNSGILFVSQESSPDAVHEALATGASGYVVKTDAGSELLIAVDSVLRGEHFVGKRFTRHDFRLVGSVDEGRTFTARVHEAAFYSDDTSFLDGFARFIEGALDVGNAAIVIATESHRKSLLQKLQATGHLNIVVAIADGRYITLDAAETLSSFMVNDMPAPARFLRIAGDLILRAAKTVNGEHSRVAACGECAPLLWSRGNAEAAIRLEQLWDKVSRVYGAKILCGYADSFYGERGRSIYERICAEHSAVHSL